MKRVFTLITLLFFTLVAERAFTQCSTTPCNTPVPAFYAPDACILPSPQALDCYYGATVNSTPQSFPPFWCTTIENNQWFAFTANAPTVVFEIEALNCASGGAIQAAILSTNDCVNFQFESSCLGNIQSGTTQILTANNLVPGQVYYLMIDGSAGALCNYAINGASSITTGPTTICIPSGNPATYTTTQTSSWTINPPGAGTILGSATGTAATVNWTQTGTAQICAQNVNCPNVPEFCLDVEIGLTTFSEETVNLCEGQSVTCAGQTYTAPGVYTQSLTNYLGCDSVITCIVNFVPTITMPPQQVTLCAPLTHNICGTTYAYSDIITQTCTNWQGCDSIVTVDLAILDPIAVITPPQALGCGASAVTYLDGSGSSFNYAPGGNNYFQWTGPGILGQANQIVILVDEPGTYCLTVTHERFGVSCTDQTCIEVEENVVVPDPPGLLGPLSVCQGAVSIYQLVPMGTVIPESYTWTTPNGEPITVNNNNTATVTWTNPVGGQLCVTANNDCGSSAPACINVTVNAGPQTPVVNGPATVCASGNAQTYAITSPQPGVTYNWTVPTGATFSGSGSSINVNFSGVSPGNVQVCATAQNNCGTSLPACANVTVTTAPQQPLLSGPASVCATGGAQTYTVTNPQAGVTYTWTAPPNATVSGSGASVTIDFNGSNSGQVCVTATNGCGNPSACQAVQVSPAPAAAISGSGSFCQGSGDTVLLNINLTGNAPWTVVYSNGAAQSTISVPSSPFALPVTQAGTYTLISVTGANNCPGNVSGSATVTQNPLPTATLTGGGSICQGSGQQVQLNIALTGTAPWTVNWQSGTNTQTPLTINASPFTLPIGQNLAGTITLTGVTDANGCQGTANGSSLVQVFSAPTVSNVETVCDPTNTFFNVSFNINGGNPATYSVSPGAGTLNGNIFTSDPIPTGSGYSFVVTDVNNCSPVTVADPIVVCDCTTTAGSMGLNTIEECGAGTVTASYDNTDEVLDGDDVLVFVLHSGSSVNIVPPAIAVSGTPQVTFNPATMNFGTTYYLSAVAGNGDGNGGVDLNDPCLSVAQGTPIIFYQLPTATLSGSSEICSGESANLLIELTGSSPWTVTINGQIISNIFSSPYTHTVIPSATTIYQLTEVTDDHCQNTASGNETVTVNTAPVVANVVTECNTTGTAFTVCFDISGGDPSCYQVAPANGTLSGNQFCSNEIPDGQGYAFQVTDCHGCPAVLVEDDLVDCNCLSKAGDMDAAQLVVCGFDLAQPAYLGGEVLDANDALCFILHAGNPNQPIATNSTPEFTFQPGTMNFGQTYFVTAAVANDDGSGCVDFSDPCLGFGANAPVVFREIPDVTIGPDQEICNGDQATLTFNMTGASPWSVVYQDDQGNNFNLDITTSPFNTQVSPATSTVYTLVSAANNFCTGTVSGQASVTVNLPPDVSGVEEICNASATGYTVKFDILGGVPGTYNVSPSTGLISGNTFTSTQIPNGQPYTFFVDDVNGCGPVEVTGIKNCNCLTDAGTMQPAPLKFCVDEAANVPVTTGQFLDPDDVLIYALHTNSGGTLGTVLATNSTPSFVFDPGTMSTGVTYYVSAVAGNSDGAGSVDLTDGCLDVALGNPLIFNALPTISISGNATICLGNATDVTFTLTGTGPFSVNHEISGVNQTPLIIPTPGTFTVTLTPPNSTSVALISVLDQGTGCDNVSNQSINIVVNPTAVAGTPTGNFAFCQDENQMINLSDNLNGADNGGIWTAPSGEMVPGGTFNTASLPAGTHTYTYTVPGTPPCLDDQVTLDVIIHPLPVADAGIDQALDCDVPDVTLGGSGTTAGATYTWVGPATLPPVINPVVSQAGNYELTVTTAFGCTDSDQVTITQNNTVLEPHITVSDVSCFGKKDGFITIDSVTGGTAPYLCSFNGSPFTGQKTFTKLSPGEYTIEIVDASSCMATLVFTIGEPQEVTVDLQGNFETGNPLVELGDPLTLQIITNPPFNELDTVIWTPTGVVPCDTCQSNTLYLDQETTFSVMIAKDGCEDEDQLTVFVRKKRPVYVPNAFSPNLDGTNDVLLIYAGKEVAGVKSFLIFNRWGETVYEFYNFLPNDPAYGWNGEHRGKPLDPAVFTWFAEVEFIDGKVELFEGDVTLMK